MDGLIAVLRGEEHQQGTWLRDLILGGQDGLVNVLGIILGIAAAGGQTHIIIAASLSAGLAEAISMGAVAYTSTLAQRDHYLKELQRERREIAQMPENEREEVRKIYAAKGIPGRLLDEVVNQICSDKEIWLHTMMKEELRLSPVDTHDVLRSSITVGVAAIVGSLIPVLPFFLTPIGGTAELLAIAVSGVALFAIGVYEAKTLVGNPLKNGAQMVTIGLGAAIAGYLIGNLLHA